MAIKKSTQKTRDRYGNKYKVIITRDYNKKYPLGFKEISRKSRKA